jgi:hypothetical protein
MTTTTATNLFGSQSTGSLLTLPDIKGTPSFMIQGSAGSNGGSKKMQATNS